MDKSFKTCLDYISNWNNPAGKLTGGKLC